MIREGHVHIELSRRPGHAAKVSYDQPGVIGHLLCGKSPSDATQIIPRLYSVCGTAQAYAAVTALERALGVEADAQTAGARAALTAMETLREHVLRIAFDWPGFCNEAPRVAEVADVMKLGAALANALFSAAPPFGIGAQAMPDNAALEQVVARARNLLEGQIFGEPTEIWQARLGMTAFAEWATAEKTIAARLFAGILRDSCFTAGSAPAQPLLPPPADKIRDWLFSADDTSLMQTSLIPETTLFTRNLHDPMMASIGGDGLGARLLARLVELAQLPERIRSLASGKGATPVIQELERGAGASAVEAARGLLIHAVALHDGLIQGYAILPPTRWNFDANGIAARCLSAIEVFDEASRLRQAYLIVNAIDPCVHYEVVLK